MKGKYAKATITQYLKAVQTSITTINYFFLDHCDTPTPANRFLHTITKPQNIGNHADIGNNAYNRSNQGLEGDYLEDYPRNNLR